LYCSLASHRPVAPTPHISSDKNTPPKKQPSYLKNLEDPLQVPRQPEGRSTN